jgi:hypothetical protein
MSFLWPAWNCAIHVGERDDSEQQRHRRNRQNQRRRDQEMVAPEPGAIHLRRVMNILRDRRKPSEDNDCRQHDLSALIVLLSFSEATLPAWTLSVPAVTLDVRSTDASAAFILIRKGKGHGDGDERFERHHRNHAHGVTRHRTHSHGMRAFNGNQGFDNHSGFGSSNRNQPDGQN